jgi:hypothetical protein
VDVVRGKGTKKRCTWSGARHEAVISIKAQATADAPSPHVRVISRYSHDIGKEIEMIKSYPLLDLPSLLTFVSRPDINWTQLGTLIPSTQ